MFRAIAILSAVIASQSSADTVTNAEQIFASWAPTSIDLRDDGTLAVFLPQRRITDTIYYSTIQAGFCMAPALNMDMSDVKAVLIGNQFKAQGWKLEAGTEICDDPSKINIAGQSLVLTDTANGI